MEMLTDEQLTTLLLILKREVDGYFYEKGPHWTATSWHTTVLEIAYFVMAEQFIRKQKGKRE